MTEDDLTHFIEFFEESFADGVLSRELRLSEEEIVLIKEKYVKAQIAPMEVEGESDYKRWYRVSFA